MITALEFYRKPNGSFDTYCRTCRKRNVSLYNGRTGKAARERAWLEYFRAERLKQEKTGAEWPPGYEEQELYSEPEVTPETALEREPLGPPPEE
jgi:hypothetical protein